MRFSKLLIPCLVVAFSGVSRSEVVYLRDGSTIHGRLVRLQNDTLYFKTSFGSEMRIPRAKVIRLEFVPAVPGAGQAGGAPDAASGGPAQGQPPGTLQVYFEDFRLMSSISVHRGKDRRGHERANSIESMLLVDGRKVFSFVDSVMDKVVRKGPETVLKNDIKPAAFKVPVAAGTHRCTLVIGNTAVGDYEDRFVNGPFRKDLLAENVVIRSGEVTPLRIGLKRSKMGLGQSYLYVLR